MKILIYGLGKEALLARKALKKEHIIIGFTDSFADIKRYANLAFYNRRAINNIYFDYIVLALSSRDISDCVREELVKEGIDEQKIIDFMQLFTRQKVDKVMCKSRNENVDGLILGLSHTLYGINPTYLSGNWKNLAMQGEDLYYHYNVLKKCADSYSNIIGNLKYVIIDMFDYPFFNYDISLTKNILWYWSLGGYAEDPHNFNLNENYTLDREKEMKQAGFYLPAVAGRNVQLAERLFDINVVEKEMESLYINAAVGNDGFRDYPLQTKLDRIIPEAPLLPYNLYYMGEKRYPKTIDENKYILEEMIKLLKQINAKIKIYFVLMPRFGNVEKYHEYLLQREKVEFENIMKDLLKLKGCFYFNFKQCKQINGNRYFWGDAAHLNYMGAIVFSGLLDEQIKKTL